MIVYNVKRRWFVEKVAADEYRVAEKLKPAALLKLDVKDRVDLAALLNALCEPEEQHKATPEMTELMDRAYVKPKALTGKDIPDCVPDFLLRSHGIERTPK